MAFNKTPKAKRLTVMSFLSRTALGLAVACTGGVIYYVHTQQDAERERLHEGVVRDQERQRYKEMLRGELAKATAVKGQTSTENKASS